MEAFVAVDIAIQPFRYLRSNTKTKFPIVAAILRLSTKYVANDLRRQTVDILKTAFPSDFDTWCRRNETRLLPHFVGETAAMITLCQQTGIRVLLPGVYYAAAKRPLADVLDDLHSLELDNATRQDICSKFITGREKLRRTEIKSILSFFEPTFARPGQPGFLTSILPWIRTKMNGWEELKLRLAMRRRMRGRRSPQVR